MLVSRHLSCPLQAKPHTENVQRFVFYPLKYGVLLPPPFFFQFTYPTKTCGQFRSAISTVTIVSMDVVDVSDARYSYTIDVSAIARQ